VRVRVRVRVRVGVEGRVRVSPPHRLATRVLERGRAGATRVEEALCRVRVEVRVRVRVRVGVRVRIWVRAALTRPVSALTGARPSTHCWKCWWLEGLAPGVYLRGAPLQRGYTGLQRGYAP